MLIRNVITKLNNFHYYLVSIFFVDIEAPLFFRRISMIFFCNFYYELQPSIRVGSDTLDHDLNALKPVSSWIEKIKLMTLQII